MLDCDQGMDHFVFETVEIPAEYAYHKFVSTTFFFAITETQASPILELSSHPITAATCICQPPSSGGHKVTLEIHLKVLEQLSVIPSGLISLQWKRKQSITNVSDPQNSHE